MTSLVLWLAMMTAAQAGKITIVSDEPGLKRAHEVRDLLVKTAPFDRITSLEVEVIPASPDQLKCQANVLDISRLVTCESAPLRKILGQRGANQLIVVKDNPTFGGSAPEFPVVTTGSQTATAIHELLHKFGLVDEYAYDAKEADVYCTRRYFGLFNKRSGPNLAFFEDAPPYASDERARSRHASDIPWFGKIKSSTMITTGTDLGTPERGVIGLYRASTCEQSRRKMKSWKPGSQTSIMEDLDSTYIPEVTWEAIANGLDGTLKTALPMREAPGAPPAQKAESSK